MAEKFARQAVVVVHGIGEQRPLDTLRGFVSGVVPTEHARFSDPDTITDRSWARRFKITWHHNHWPTMPDADAAGLTPADIEANTDFFELYWAPRFRDTSWSDLTSWGLSLLRRDRLALTTTRLRAHSGVAFLAVVAVAIVLLATLATAGMAIAPTYSAPKRAIGVGLTVIGLVALGIGWRANISMWRRFGCAAVAVGIVVLTFNEIFRTDEFDVTTARMWTAILIVIGAAVVSVVASFWYGPLTTGKVALTLAIPLAVTWVAASSVFTRLDSGGPARLVGSPPSFVGAIVAAAIPLVLGGLALRFGDVPRYTVRSPRNIEEIEHLLVDAVQVLERLHAEQRPSGDFTYERIIVVGHSLGSVIAYDALRLYWSKVNEKLKFVDPALPPPEASGTERPEIQQERTVRRIRRARAAAELGAAAAVLDPLGVPERRPPAGPAPANREFRRAQHRFWETVTSPSPDDDTIRKPDRTPVSARWAVSDLVTLGSPLAHAELLLAKGFGELEMNFDERIWPRCPPRRQSRDKLSILFRHSEDEGVGTSSPHQAALFAACRWTNIYWGRDLIGGNVGRVYGPGVEDHDPLGKGGNGNTWDLRGSFHSHYWRRYASGDQRRRVGSAQSIDALRAIIQRGPRLLVTVEPAAALQAAAIVDNQLADVTAADLGSREFVELEVRYRAPTTPHPPRRVVLGRKVPFDRVANLASELEDLPGGAIVRLASSRWPSGSESSPEPTEGEEESE